MPPKARTWARRGCTPRLRIAARGPDRISLAGLLAYRPGCRPRLMFRTLVVRNTRRPHKKSLLAPDLARMLDTAHYRLGGAPIVLIWDNDSAHRSRVMQALIAARPWLTVAPLPPYAPDLNPTESVWSHLKRSLANLAPCRIDELHTLVKTRLRHIQYRPALLEAFLADTGLRLKPP